MINSSWLWRTTDNTSYTHPQIHHHTSRYSLHTYHFHNLKFQFLFNISSFSKHKMLIIIVSKKYIHFTTVIPHFWLKKLFLLDWHYNFCSSRGGNTMMSPITWTCSTLYFWLWFMIFFKKRSLYFDNILHWPLYIRSYNYGVTIVMETSWYYCLHFIEVEDIYRILTLHTLIPHLISVFEVLVATVSYKSVQKGGTLPWGRL